MVANFRSPFTLVSFRETRVVRRAQCSNETTGIWKTTLVRGFHRGRAKRVETKSSANGERGWMARDISLPPAEGEECLLTSPFIGRVTWPDYSSYLALN
jgi:hypothetical protein